MNRKAQAFHPGEYLCDEMATRGWTVNFVAKSLDVTDLHMMAILDGRAPITEPLAVILAGMMNTSPRFWLRMQEAWDAREADG